MAYFSERHLHSKETEDFLIKKGFTLCKDCRYSLWQSESVVLKLNGDDVILRDEELYQHLYHKGYMSGVRDGKEEALEKIFQGIRNFVYPKTTPQPYN